MAADDHKSEGDSLDLNNMSTKKVSPSHTANDTVNMSGTNDHSVTIAATELENLRLDLKGNDSAGNDNSENRSTPVDEIATDETEANLPEKDPSRKQEKKNDGNDVASPDSATTDLTTRTGSGNGQKEGVPDSNGNVFRNVHYSTSGQPTPTFRNFYLDNVDFIECEFKETNFHNVKLTNVALYNFKFDNVTILDVTLVYPHCELFLVCNAARLDKAPPSGDRGVHIATLGPLNPPIIGLLTRCHTGRVSPKNERSLWLHERCLRLGSYVAKRRHGQFPFRPTSYEAIMVRILQLCIPAAHDHIQKHHQAPKRIPRDPAKLSSSRLLKDNTKITSYSLRDADSFEALLSSTRTWLAIGSNFARGPVDQTQCSEKSLQAYLHPLKASTREDTLILHYNFNDEPGVAPTCDETWFELMKHICHSASSVPEINLVIGQRF